MSPAQVCIYNEQDLCGIINTDPLNSMAAAPAAPPTPGPPQPPQHVAFLQKWNASIQPRLTQLLALLSCQEVAKSLALAQVNEMDWPCSLSNLALLAFALTFV